MAGRKITILLEAAPHLEPFKAKRGRLPVSEERRQETKKRSYENKRRRINAKRIAQSSPAELERAQTKIKMREIRERIQREHEEQKRLAEEAYALTWYLAICEACEEYVAAPPDFCDCPECWPCSPLRL